MLESDKGEVGEATVHFQVIDEAAHPGSATLRIRPDTNIFRDTFKDGAAEFYVGIDLVNRRRPLQIKRGVIFGQHVLPVGLFSHFHVANGIAALFNVGDFSGGIFRRAIEQRDRNHGGKIIRDAAGEENIETAVFIFSSIVNDITGCVPGVDGGSDVRRLIIVCVAAIDGGFRILGRQNKIPRLAIRALADAADLNLLDGVTHTVANVLAAMFVAGVGRLRH